MKEKKLLLQEEKSCYRMEIPGQRGTFPLHAPERKFQMGKQIHYRVGKFCCKEVIPPS